MTNPTPHSQGGELLDLLRVAKCPNCDGSGSVPVQLGEHFCSREMAMDAGDPSMEGSSLGVEWGQQQCEWCARRNTILNAPLSPPVSEATKGGELTESERDQFERYRQHLREKIYVDATPDDGLPVRILSAHLDESTVESNPAPLGELMNEWQAQRNAIIRAAIATLSAPSATKQTVGEGAFAKNWEVEPWVGKTFAIVSQDPGENDGEIIAEFYGAKAQENALRLLGAVRPVSPHPRDTKAGGRVT